MTFFRKDDLTTAVLAAAVAATLVLSCSPSHAGGLAPKQTPDNWSNLEYHAGGHFIIGIAIATAKPDWHPLAQWGACQVPGAIHEFAPSRGNYRSNRDLIANAVGCALGLWAGRGFGIEPLRDGVRVTYSWEVK